MIHMNNTAPTTIQSLLEDPEVLAFLDSCLESSDITPTKRPESAAATLQALYHSDIFTEGK